MRSEWPSISVPRKWDCMLEVGTGLGQSTAGHATQSENLFWTESIHVKLLDVIVENELHVVCLVLGPFWQS